MLTDVLLVPTAVMGAWWWRKRPITSRADNEGTKSQSRGASTPGVAEIAEIA